MNDVRSLDEQILDDLDSIAGDPLTTSGFANQEPEAEFMNVIQDEEGNASDNH